MALPYMGSKRKSASKIVNVIDLFSKNHNKIAVDLFTGGFAVGEAFLKKGYKVYANDKNKYIIALLQALASDTITNHVLYDWVSRADFESVMKNKTSHRDWYIGYLQVAWTFGNNQSGYLYGPQKEPIKKALHALVIDKQVIEPIETVIKNKKHINSIIGQPSINTRIKALKKVINYMYKKDLIDYSSYRAYIDIQHIESVNNIKKTRYTLNKETVSRLENIERTSNIIETSKNINNKTVFTSVSYEEVNIPDGAVVYCDPPYKGTSEYAESGFNHKVFWDYIRKLSKTHDVYISEYTAPDDFTCIYEFSQKSTLQGGTQKHNKQPTEKLFKLI